MFKKNKKTTATTVKAVKLTSNELKNVLGGGSSTAAFPALDAGAKDAAK